MTSAHSSRVVAAAVGSVGLPAKRAGRPVSGTAKTNAERQRAFRARNVLVPAGDLIPATIERLAKQFDLTTAEVTRELLRFALCNRKWSKQGFPGVSHD